MPQIPTYERRISIPGESGNVKGDIGSAGVVGHAMQGFGNAVSGIGDELGKIYANIKKVEDDNYLIDEGSKITRSYLDFKINTEKDPQYLSGNYEGMSKTLGDFTTSHMKSYEGIVGDRPELLSRIKQHIMALDSNTAGHFATISSSRIKTNSDTVRKTDLATSKQMARTGDYGLANKNYIKTLDAQRLNGTLSKEEYDYERKTGESEIAEDYITNIMETDPVSANAIFKVLKDGDSLTAEAIDRLTKVVKPAAQRQTGTLIGREIFEQNSKEENIEAMIGKAKEKKLDADTEGHAIAEIKDSWNIRKTNQSQIKENAVKKVNEILVPIALQKNGMNKASDLTPTQWAELTRDNPEYAQKLQDSMRRETNETARLARAEAREDRVAAAIIKRERKEAQDDNETNIMLDPDFINKNLDSELALGNIGKVHHKRLTELQAKKDPMKNSAVTSALSRVNTGAALGDALGVENKADLAIWKQKYGDLIKAFAYNNYDDPNFETKLSDFMEKHVLSKLVTSFFATDKTDRTEKFKTAQDAADPMPEKQRGNGVRADGTKKANGFLGPIERPDGKVSTEISIGVNINGKEMEIPTLVPTLTKEEIASLIKGEKPSDIIINKAVDHAKLRISKGKSPFAGNNESPTDKKRQQAIDILKQNGKPLTESNINYIKGQIK